MPVSVAYLTARVTSILPGGLSYITARLKTVPTEIITSTISTAIISLLFGEGIRISASSTGANLHIAFGNIKVQTDINAIHVFIELRLSSAYLCQHVPFHYRYRSNLQFAGFQFEVDVVLLARFELIAGKFLFGYFHLHLLPVHGQCQGDVARQGGGKQQQVVRNGSSGCIQGLCRHSRGKPGGRAVCIRRCFKRLVGGAFVYFVSFQR